MARVVGIGIDGLDADLLRVYGPSLPHLRRLMLESPYLELQSSFPPDPAPAWASIYSGQHPAQHGILPPSNARAEQDEHQLSRLPDGAAFWESASNAGKRVCVINPLNAYPASLINGVMLTLPPSESNGCGVSVTTNGDITLEQFPSVLDIPAPASARHLAQYCQSLRDSTERQTDSALELWRSAPWDLFFIQYEALDLVQHLCWRYSDPGDPTYPGNNEHAGRIRDCYALFDQVIGRFQAEMEADCVLLLVSGYGHGRGSATNLNLNEWLRQEELLVSKARSRQWLGSRELLRHLFSGRRSRMSNALAARHALPVANTHAVDEQKTQAHVVLLSSSCNIGGIALNRNAISNTGGDYEDVRHSIIQRLLHLRLHGRPVAQWVKKREEMYDGPYVDRYPDILFELRSDYAISDAVQVSLTTDRAQHWPVSGTHRTQGVILLSNLPGNHAIRETLDEPTVVDIAPTILALLDVAGTGSNGQSLVIPAQPQPATAMPLT